MKEIYSDEINPLVSIIITTYNHGHFIRDAIESALNQSYKNIEILIIDDGSTDNTNEIVEAYHTVKYIYQDNKGLSAARNTGIEKSSGDFVLFLDADDFLYTDGIKLNIEILAKNTSIAFVSGSYKYVDINKNEEESISHQVDGNHFQRLVLSNYIGMHGAVLYRKNIIEKCLYDTSLKSSEDYDLYLRITKDHKVIHHSGYIAAYRRVGNSMSSNIPLMLKTTLRVLDKNLKYELSNDKIEKLYIRSKNNFIELYCNNAKEQLKKNSIKKFTKRWFLTVALVLRYRFFSTIKFFLKKIRDKSFSLLPWIAANSKSKETIFSIYVLMYHKIHNPILDIWGLSVSKENFESHLKYFKQTGSVLNTSELLEYLNGEKTLTKNHLYITFDDGYEDNAFVAAPLLESYQIPATFFITNNSLTNSPTFFWWDILEYVFLKQLLLPVNLSINNKYCSVSINLESENNLEYIDIETLLWKGKESVNKRTAAYLQLWQILMALNYPEQQALMAEIILWSKVDLKQLDANKIMNKGILLELQNNPFIEIGGHTKSHLSLSQIEKSVQEVEIKDNKIDLENTLKRELKVFAYPYGRVNSDANTIVSKMGYLAAFTCVHHPITKGFDKLNLGRYQVFNSNASELEKMLKKAGFYNLPTPRS